MYLKAEGLPEWRQPNDNFKLRSKSWTQTDEHPVVDLSWDQAMKLCEWLSKVTGKEWRLPTNAEWDLAVGKARYPWGEYFPPSWDDGNYSVLLDGQPDPLAVGVDGITGTAPVASFKPNILGFYDLGGNVREWILDGKNKKSGKHVLRGGGWSDWGPLCEAARHDQGIPFNSPAVIGLRLVRRSGS